jgi:uncharacterized membrane protein
MAEGAVQSIEISAPPSVVFAVLTDLPTYPEWITAMRSVRVKAQTEDGLAALATFEVDAMVKVISYDLEYEYDVPHRISWTALPGADITEMEGSYELSELEGGSTEVVYALKVDYSFPLPGFLRRQAEKQLVGTALRGLKKRVEEVQTG